MRVIFFGTGPIGIPALESLAVGQCVVGVVTQPDRPAGRSMAVRPSPIKEVALRLGLPVWQPEKIAEACVPLGEEKPDLIVVAAYGQILPARVLGIPRRGCLNIHASLLPRHRGASPVHAAILHGDTRTGITIMWMDEGLDTGDILLSHACDILPEDTAGTLHDRLAALAPAALLEALGQIENGTALRRPQDSSAATYAPKINKADARIDWNQPSAKIVRQIRGLHPWPCAFTCLPGGPVLKIHAASVDRDFPPGGPGWISTTGARMLVGTGEGAVELLEVQSQGGKRLKAGDFLRGHPLPTGTRFES